jgi:hypothetical protein
MKKSKKLTGLLIASVLVLVIGCEGAVDSEAVTPTPPDPTPNTLSAGSWGTIGSPITDRITGLTLGRTYVVKVGNSATPYRGVTADGKLASVGDKATVAEAATSAAPLSGSVTSITGLAVDGKTYDVILVFTTDTTNEIVTFKDTYVLEEKTLTVGASITVADDSTLTVAGALVSGDSTTPKVTTTGTGMILDKNGNAITTTGSDVTVASVGTLIGQLNASSIGNIAVPNNTTLTATTPIVASGEISGGGTIKTSNTGSFARIGSSRFTITTNITGLAPGNLNTCIGLVDGSTGGVSTGNLSANAILNVSGALSITTGATLNVAAGAEIVIGSGGQITLTKGAAETSGRIVLKSAAAGTGAKLSFVGGTGEDVVGQTAAAAIEVIGGAGTATPAANFTGLTSTLSRVKSIQANSVTEEFNITIKGDINNSNSGILSPATTFKTGT